MITGMILVMIYNPLAFDFEEFRGGDMAACAAEAATRLDKELTVTIWDDMNGSHPIPKVVTAFCVQGALKNLDDQQ